jgi:hypothetical protein
MEVITGYLNLKIIKLNSIKIKATKNEINIIRKHNKEEW